MELLEVIGSIRESFYELGQRDALVGKHVHTDVKRMLQTPWKPVNIALEEAAKVIIKNTLLKNGEASEIIENYSRGIGIEKEEMALIMLIPELVSSMSKWAPTLPKGKLGCSSFFAKNPNGEVIHGRILDFPLQGSFDHYERAITYKLDGYPVMMGFGASGIPYPSITLLTEDGMTLALHQNFTDHFNTQGLSIFEYILKLIKEAKTKEEVITFINNHMTMTSWSLYISFANGDVLATQISPVKNIINEHILKDGDILYFCNELENKELNQNDYAPLGINHYNQLRRKTATLKIENFKKKKPDQGITELELLELMSSPIKQSNELSDLKDFHYDTITPTSISIMVMNPTAKKAFYITKNAPKTFKDSIVEISDVFNTATITNVKIKKGQITDENYTDGLYHIMEAQRGFDLKISTMAYHHLQMAIKYLEDYPEKHIAHFYFLIAQYIFETDKKVLINILKEFKNLEGHLPEYLNDHALLFIGRLERILSLPSTMEEDKIQNKKLLASYQKEEVIPQLLFHRLHQMSVLPRMDIFDIIYLQV